MGNFQSQSKSPQEDGDFKNFYDLIDYISTYYILTMDFQSLTRLSEREYCDNLVVLTSKIIEENFSDLDITYLSQRVREGVEVNDMKQGNVVFVSRDKLDNLDASNDAKKNLNKKRICIGIAKFYVKIAHIFAAIITTINPVYVYKDSTGQTVKATLMEKSMIPKGATRKLFKVNICDDRIRALQRGMTDNPESEVETLQPKVCEMNMGRDGQVKTLGDEPGIPELERLYLDDEYDYSNGTFKGMSEATARDFKRDLQIFYTAFTGETTMPESIRTFSDIRLRDYGLNPGCRRERSVLKQQFKINKKDDLFIQYAENIKTMIQRATDNQSKLLEVINMLFTFVYDPYSGEKVIRVNPRLNEETLQKAVDRTRSLIMDLYINCERDYVKGVKLYEAIVETKIADTTRNQIQTLERESERLMADSSELLPTTPSAAYMGNQPIPRPPPAMMERQRVEPRPEYVPSRRFPMEERQPEYMLPPPRYPPPRDEQPFQRAPPLMYPEEQYGQPDVYRRRPPMQQPPMGYGIPPSRFEEEEY